MIGHEAVGYRKYLAPLAAAAAMVSLVAGCGPEAHPGTNGEAAPSASPAPAGTTNEAAPPPSTSPESSSPTEQIPTGPAISVPTGNMPASYILTNLCPELTSLVQTLNNQFNPEKPPVTCYFDVEGNGTKESDIKAGNTLTRFDAGYKDPGPDPEDFAIDIYMANGNTQGLVANEKTFREIQKQNNTFRTKIKEHIITERELKKAGIFLGETLSIKIGNASVPCSWQPVPLPELLAQELVCFPGPGNEANVIFEDFINPNASENPNEPDYVSKNDKIAPESTHLALMKAALAALAKKGFPIGANYQ